VILQLLLKLLVVRGDGRAAARIAVAAGDRAIAAMLLVSQRSANQL